MKQSFHEAVFELFEKMIEEYKDIEFAYPVNAYLTGGAAIYLLTKMRASDDVDAILTQTVDFPTGVVTVWEDEGIKKTLSYDDNYHPDFGLIAEDYEDRSFKIKCLDNKINIKVLHPLDIIITKMSRFSAGDEEDIQAIIRAFDIDKELLIKKVHYELEGRFLDEWKLKDYEYKLEDICEMIDEKNTPNRKESVSSSKEIKDIIEKNIT